MDTTNIKAKIADFLKNYPPFSILSEVDLMMTAEQISVRFYHQNDYLYQEGEPAHNSFYALRQGSVELYRKKDKVNSLIDICEEGDVFGTAALLANRPYVTSAKCNEDSLIYAIPWALFKDFFDKYPKISLYFAAGFATGFPIHASLDEIEQARRDYASDEKHLPSSDDVRIIETKEHVITCNPETTIRDAARMMRDHNIGSMIIADTQKRPLGIITDTDFRKKVIPDEIPLQTSVDKIMSSPVLTVPPDQAVANIILTMMKHNIHHLCITEDGTTNSSLKGIISQHDVLLSHGNNPAVLIKEINQNKDLTLLPAIRNRAEELVRHYLLQETSIPFITGIITEINDALIHKAITVAMQKLEEEGSKKPPLKFAWLSLGSEGRKEQLLRTDQDNAIVYENPPDDMAASAKEYFLSLGTKVTATLADCGFVFCPAEIMARNPMWCKPISEWQEQFRRWITVPEPKALMNSTIFFDFRVVFGENAFATAMHESIFESINSCKIFMPMLARNALLNPPPLSFFKSFIVERGGEHKNELDIKLRGMMPLADAARVLALDMKITDAYSTFERLEKIATMNAGIRPVAEEATYAYELMMRYRATNGLLRKDSGRYINPDSLKKIEKHTLRNAFRTIEEIQQILSVRYQTDLIRQ